MKKAPLTFSSGFTLIELLVVISVISLLASAVLTQLQDIRESAKYAQARSDIRLMINASQMAQQNSGGVPLKEITGGSCSGCRCRGEENLQSMEEGHESGCVKTMRQALQSISQVAGPAYRGLFEKVERDPWGSPYLLDENEDTSGPGLGTIKSVGPNGVTYTADGDEDDLILTIPSS